MDYSVPTTLSPLPLNDTSLIFNKGQKPVG